MTPRSIIAAVLFIFIAIGLPTVLGIWDNRKNSSPEEMDNAMIDTTPSPWYTEIKKVVFGAGVANTMHIEVRSGDTSTCWVKTPCDTPALLDWHIKEIQKLQKARLWKSKPKVKPEPEPEIDTALLRELEEYRESRRGIDWDYTSPLNYMELQNERHDDTWILTCDTCPAVKKRDYYKYGANWNLGYTKRPASLDSAIKKVVDSLNKRRLQ